MRNGILYERVSELRIHPAPAGGIRCPRRDRSRRSAGAEKKRSGWATFGLVLLWIYFLPVMATIAIWKSKKIPTVWKWILTLVLWGVVLLIYSDSKSSSAASPEGFAGTMLRFIV